MINTINFNKKIIMFFIIFFSLFFANILCVFAGGIKDEETDVNANTMMDNPRLTYKSDYISKSGERVGYEFVEFTIPTADGPVTQILKYYHYVRVRVTKDDGTDRGIPLWLYKWTNQEFDKEIETEMDRLKKENVSMLGFYDPTGNSSAHVPDESVSGTFMNYFMWPMSSNGDTLLYAEQTEGGNKPIVLKHDMNDFTYIKDPKNFSLAFILDENTFNYGTSYVNAGYKYPVPGTTFDKFKDYLKDVELLLKYGEKWGSPNYLSKNASKFYIGSGVSYGGKTYNGNFNDETQTFIEHINYAAKKLKGSEAAAVTYSRTMTSTTKGYEKKSPYLFLTYEKTPVYPRIVWNADSTGLGYSREVANYSRSLNVTSDGSYNTISGQKPAYENGRDTDGWAKNAGLNDNMGVLNDSLLAPWGANISSLNNYDEYSKVHDKAISTFWAFCRTYQGFYYDIATWTKSYADSNSKRFNNDVKELATKLPKTVVQFNRAGTGKSYTAVDGKTYTIKYEEFYKMSQLMTMTMARYYMISGFSCKETAATLYVRTQAEGYRSFDNVLLHYELPVSAAVTTGDVAITNTPNSQSVMNNLTIVDLRLGLGVPNSDYSSFVGIIDEMRGTAANYNGITIAKLIDKLTSEKVTFFTTTAGKRAATLLLAGYQGKDVGIYLTNPEIEKGEVKYNAGNKTLDFLDSETVYVVAVTVQYSNSYKNSKIPDILSGKYNISAYNKIGIESQEFLDNDALIKSRETLKTLVSSMTYPLFKQQVSMFANNPRVQIMMVVSDASKYSTKEATVWTTAKKYLNQIDTTLYSKKFDTDATKKTFTQNYFYELFEDKGKDDYPLINSNLIKFSLSEGSNRLTGFTSVSDTAARYFEIVDTDFTTSDIRGQDKLIDKTNKTAKVLITHESASALGNFVKRNNSYNLKATDVYGYWNLDNVYKTGTLDFSDSLTYFATFYVPKYADKIAKNIVYSRNLDEKLDASNKSLYSATGVKTTVNATNLSAQTKGVKFIARIASNSSGIFEDLSELEALSNTTIKDLVAFLKKNYMNLGNITRVEVLISTENKIILNEDGSLIINVMNKKIRDDFGLAVNNYLKTCLNKADNKALKLTAIRNGLDIEEAYSSLGVNATTAILLSLYIQDANKLNDVSFISASINTPAEDILVANNLNTDVSYSSGKAEDRRSIDWTTDSSSNYELKASLELSNNKIGKNILTATNAINKEDAFKIRSKNTTLSTPTESTKIYGDVFIGRIPEAKKTGLYVGDYKMIMYERFNVANSSADKLTNLTSLDSIKLGLKEGKTKKELVSYFDKLNSYYYTSVLYNLALGKSSLGNIKITPIAYKKVADESSIVIANNKITKKVAMTAWTEINSEADTAKLTFSPGMAVQYRWEYNLPYGTQPTTIKYMNAQAGKLYKSSYSTLKSLSSAELNFVLIPTMKSDGAIKNTKAISSDVNNKNNFAKMSVELSDGGNLTFVDVVIKTATTNKTVYSKTYTYEKALEAGNVLNVLVNRDSLEKDANGNIKEDLKVSVKVYYKNLFNKDKTTKNTKLPIKVSNYFYDTVRTGMVNSSIPASGPYREGEISYNDNFTDTTYLIIPTSKNIDVTGFLEIICPGTDPRDSVDNIIETDLEKIKIVVGGPEKDNAVTDIVLYKNNINGKILGVNNDNSSTNLMGQSILENNSDVTRAIQVRTKVKRLEGTIKEDKHALYLNLLYIRDAQRVEDYRILTSYNTSVSSNGGLNSPGATVYFDSVVLSASKQISSLTAIASYRTSDNLTYFDGADYDMSNNVRTESWMALYDIDVELEKPNDITYTVNKGLNRDTTPMNPKGNFSVNANVEITVNNGMYIGEQINAEVDVYLLNVANNRKYYPDSVSGITDYRKTNGSGKMAISGGGVKSITLNFKDLALIAGECSVYVSVKPDKYQLLETTPWNSDPKQTNNIDIKTFNAIPSQEDILEFICLDPQKTPDEIRWNTKFTWSNMVKSRPVQTDQWYSYTDSYGSTRTYFVCCSCNSQSGKNNGLSNWGPNGDRYNNYGVEQGPYYEKVTAIPNIWTSSGGWKTKSSMDVYTGESIRVRLKVVHSSNRDVLPNALYYDEMGYNTPYSMNGIGHAWGCDYLSRWPGVSRIEGPQQLHYQISGTRGFDKETTKGYDSIETNGIVNRTLWWDLLPQVSIPVTNKTQTINIKYEVIPYWGYNFTTDPLHISKKLCTTGTINIKILPSTTIPVDDGYEGIKVETGVE